MITLEFNQKEPFLTDGIPDRWKPDITVTESGGMYGVSVNVHEDDSSYRYRALMQRPKLTLKFSLPFFVEFPVGTSCKYMDQTFYLQRPEDLKKQGTRNIEYTMEMGGKEEYLSLYKMRNTVDGRLKFSMTAKPHEFIEEIVANMNARSGEGTWKVGTCLESTEKTVEFNHTYCDEALEDVANVFETEYEISSDLTVSLKKVEYNKESPLALAYGKGNGFVPGVGRSASSDDMPVKRLYVQGGDTNIDRSTYGSKFGYTNNPSELRLPKGQELEYEGRTYRSDDDGYYIERSDKVSDAVKEDSLDCSEIYPSRVGTVSSVEVANASKNFYDIIDTSIPDNLNFNDYLIDGETMTVIFQSGMLAGDDKEFEVTYKHSEKRFELVPQEIDGVTMPNETFCPVAGDTYAVFGCMLPDEYICDNDTQTGAAWDMMKEAARKLYECEDQQFTFSGELQGLWAKKNWLEIGGKLLIGGYVLFTDDQFAPDGALVRITGIKDYLTSPYSPTIEISNSVSGSSLTSSLRQISNTEVVIDNVQKQAVQYTKRRFRDAKETMTMLNEALLGNYTESINPITVQTMQMIAGDESLQFRFVDSMSNPKQIGDTIAYSQDGKVLTVGESIIQHMTLGISDISSGHAASEYKFWEMEAYTSPYLDNADAKYYLYAKVSKTGNTGAFLLSESAIAMEQVAGYYHLLVGILNSEYDGERSFATLYGYTEVLPGRITTDRIVSSDGESYFDMLNSALKLSDKLQYNVNGNGLLKLKGTIVQSSSGDEDVIACFRGVFNSSYWYYKGDTVTFAVNGKFSLFRYTSDTPTKGILPTDTAYWTVEASCGDYVSYAFKESTERPDTPQDTKSIPDGWSDTPSGTGRWWMSKATIDGATGKAGTWSTPVQVTAEDGTDGAYTDFKYAKNTSDSTAPSIAQSSRNPTGWSDTPPSLNEGEYLWMTQAEVDADNNLVGTWSTPVRISGEKGDQGVMGDWTSYVFKMSTTQPSAPTGTSSLPSGWSDAPDGTGRWWMSKATIDGATGKAGTWSTPVQVTAEDGTDGAYTDFKYAKNTSDSTAPSITTSSRNPGSNWSDTPPSLGENEYLWMTQAEIDANDTLNGSWSTPVRISGEKGATGDTGAAGNYTEYRYQKNGSISTAPDLSISTRNPSGWNTSMPDISIGYYLWMTKAEIKGSDDTLVGSWSTPVRVTPYDGADGKSPAGVFCGVYDSSKTYYGTEYRLDVIKYGNVYKIARIDAGTFSGKAPTNTAYWNDFGSNFESVATQLLLAEWALIGSWVLRNGSLTSTDGLLNGESSTDYTDGSFVPAVLLDSDNGQIKLGDNLVLDKYSMGMYDDSNYNKVKIINASVGTYDSNMGLASRSSAQQQLSTTYPAHYFATTGTSYAMGLESDVVHIGFMENGSTIKFSTIKLSMTVPYIGDDGELTIKTTAPVFQLILYRDNGIVVETLSYAASDKSYTSGNTMTLTYYPSKTITITKATEGDLYFKIITKNMNAQASVTGTSKAATLYFYITWAFTRTNYQRTLIGYDGLLSCFGNGMIHFSSNGFIAKYGDSMLRISSDGIQTSSDGGSTWKSVN